MLPINLELYKVIVLIYSTFIFYDIRLTIYGKIIIIFKYKTNKNKYNELYHELKIGKILIYKFLFLKIQKR